MQNVVSSFLSGICFGLILAIILYGITDPRKARQAKCLWPMENGSFTAEPFTKTCFISNNGSQKVDCTTLMRMDEFNHMKHRFQ